MDRRNYSRLVSLPKESSEKPLLNKIEKLYTSMDKDFPNGKINDSHINLKIAKNTKKNSSQIKKKSWIIKNDNIRIKKKKIRKIAEGSMNIQKMGTLKNLELKKMSKYNNFLSHPCSPELKINSLNPAPKFKYSEVKNLCAPYFR